MTQTLATEPPDSRQVRSLEMSRCLVAVVGGNEVTNPFVVTEVYVRQGGAWKLGSLSFTRLLGP